MKISHENIKDDSLTQLYFTAVHATNDLLPAHWHNHVEVIYMTSGHMLAYINEISYHLKPGDFLIINTRDIHYTHAQGDCHYYLLQIPTSHLEHISPDWELVHFLEYVPLASSLNASLTVVLRELVRLDEQREKGYRLLFLVQVYQLLYLIYTQYSTLLNTETRSRNDRDFKRIEQCMQYVRKNYRNPITLAEISDYLSLAPSYFCRLFKKYTGQTFLTYVNQVRLLHFYQDLIHQDESINLLMDKNGITNYKLFMRMFKEAYGDTPHSFRKKLLHSSST